MNAAQELRAPRWLAALLWSSSLLPSGLRLLVWLALSEAVSYQRLLPADVNQRNTLLYLAVVFLFKTLILHRLEAFPGGRSVAYRLAVVAGLFAATFFVILALRLDYARSGLFVGMGLLLTGELVLALLRERLEVAHYKLVPPVTLDLPVPTNMRLQLADDAEAITHDILVVEPEAQMTSEWLRFVVRHSALGQRVISRQQLQEKMTGRVVTTDLSVMEMERVSPSWFLLLAKRVLDVVVVLVALPLVLPVGLLVGLLVRAESSGSALFRQARIGKDGVAFSMYKFRSMREQTVQEARFASDESDRITRVGYFIRATHLDELPQLFNVLKGDMSLVGPRPEQPEFVAKFEQDIPFYRYRHLVKPGITGWAQVCQGYAADTDSTVEKLSYDFYYIKNLSVWLDVLILVRTLRSVLVDRHPERKT